MTCLEILELENDICELRYMAHLLARQVEDHVSPSNDLAANVSAFLAYNVENRVSALLQRYYSALDQAKPVLRGAR